MKSVIFIIATLMVSNLFAQGHSFINLSNVDQVDMSTKANSITVGVDYPGDSISGVCHIEIVADSYRRGRSIEKFLEAVRISDLSGKTSSEDFLISNTILRIGLTPGLYVDGITIQTRSGKTLEQSLKETLGEGRTVVLRPRSC